jgi:hypothetical protein
MKNKRFKPKYYQVVSNEKVVDLLKKVGFIESLDTLKELVLTYKKENYKTAQKDINLRNAVNDSLYYVSRAFDSKYPDHISNSKELWAISTINGMIAPIDKGKVKNYRLLSLFRSYEEASAAYDLLDLENVL